MIHVDNDGTIRIGVDPATRNPNFFGGPRPLVPLIRPETCPDDDPPAGELAAKVASLNELAEFWVDRARALAKEAEAQGSGQLALELHHLAKVARALKVGGLS